MAGGRRRALPAPLHRLPGAGAKGARIITRADNIYLWDSEGHKILDAMSGLWCVNVGYGQQALIDAATRSCSELPFYNAFFQTATPPAIELAELLAEVTPPQFQHVFFSGLGLRGQRHRGAHGAPLLGPAGPARAPGDHQPAQRLPRLDHGRRVAGRHGGMHAQGGLPIPGIVHIEQPYWWEHGRPGLSRDDFGLRAAGWLEQKILELGADKVAAFIGEPVQGAGGVIMPPSHLLARDPAHLRQARHPAGQRRGDLRLRPHRPLVRLRDHGLQARPDDLRQGRHQRLRAAGRRDGRRARGRVLIEQGGEFNHGYTYSGHPVACAVGLANLRLIRELALVEHVHDDVGPYLAEAFAQLAEHPLVGEAETCGLMGACCW
jgi:putrescine aminotransferase